MVLPSTCIESIWLLLNLSYESLVMSYELSMLGKTHNERPTTKDPQLKTHC